MNKPTVIGIAGLARSGKSTVADIMESLIRERFLVETKQVAFADPIKEMLNVINIPTDDDSKTKITYLEETPRKLMQSLGTEWGRNLIDSNIWIKVLHEKIKDENVVIIPDVRFPNEAEYVRTNGTLIHVKGRGGIPGIHESEQGLKVLPDESIIYNNGTLSNLYFEVQSYVITVGGNLPRGKTTSIGQPFIYTR